jgi:formylglycine-generating enzyme required for sulfatase activity
MKGRRTPALALLCLGLLGLVASAAAASRGQVLFTNPSGRAVGLYRESHALLIGESRYTAGWPDLTAVPQELDKVEGMLQAQGFQVTKRLDLKAEDLRKAIADFINRYGFAKDNRLLIYFAGHGHTLERGYGEEMGYIVPADAPDPRQDRDGFLGKAVSMNQVLTWAREIEAKHVLFLFDSCFSGSVFAARDLPEVPPHISDLTAEPVREFITAGKANQTVPAQSVFAPAFVDAIGQGLADLDQDGYVTGTELGLYLQRVVPQYARQNPQYGKITDYLLARGDFVFQVGAAQLQSAGQKPPPAAVQPRGSEPTGPAPAPAAAAPKAGETWTEPTTGMPFVWVLGGCFQMGSPPKEAGHDRDEQQHQACVDGFWMGKYEVTNGQYRKFKPSHDSGEYSGKSLNGDDQPVVEVSWNDAVAYAEWLSRKPGQRFRLPTEAEWEYAARAGTRTARYWGDDPSGACRYANVYDRTGKAAFSFSWEAHDCDDGMAATAPVGRFQPNGFGLYDMLGNVWEWTCSAYDDKYAGGEGRCADQTDGGPRVARGGSWDGVPRTVRSANRDWLAPGYRGFDLGFRLARTP